MQMTGTLTVNTNEISYTINNSNLEELHFKNCPNLYAVLSPQMPNLKNIYISGCPKLHLDFKNVNLTHG